MFYVVVFWVGWVFSCFGGVVFLMVCFLLFLWQVGYFCGNDVLHILS